MSESEKLVADVVRAAGNRIVGRVRLQKMVYLLDQLGLNSGFKYSYHHYGPYSESLADAVEFAKAFGLIDEETDYRISDGVPFSIFESLKPSGETQVLNRPEMSSAINAMQRYSATVLELAATIHWLINKEKIQSWQTELERRKGVKADLPRVLEAVALLREIGLSPSE